MIRKLYNSAPVFLQNVFITLYNLKAYSYRYTGRYEEFFKELLLPAEKNNVERLKDLKSFIRFVKEYSPYYKNEITFDLDDLNSLENIRQIPIITKRELKENVDSIVTIPKKSAITAKTGGTTGIPLKVYYTKEDTQRRFANVDSFRAHYGYSLNKKTAWFSGRALLKPTPNKAKFWRTDYLFNTRYYSTYHINDQTAKFYLRDILKYKPLYFVGYPSCLYELASYGLNNGIEHPDFIKAIFPNAETITEEMREIIEKYFNTEIHDQYGSCEGAPHIFQYDGHYKFDPREGFLEVLDENNKPAQTGRMIVTSYHTKGTPLLRYDIGDIAELEEKFDYNKIPKIKKILGREMNSIISPDTGNIHVPHISDTTNNINGVIRIQVIQKRLDSIDIKLKISNNFSQKDKKNFINNIRKQIGCSMEINLEYVEEIPRERMVSLILLKIT